MALQDRADGHPNLGIRFTLALRLNADGTHGCSGNHETLSDASNGRLINPG